MSPVVGEYYADKTALECMLQPNPPFKLLGRLRQVVEVNPKQIRLYSPEFTDSWHASIFLSIYTLCPVQVGQRWKHKRWNEVYTIVGYDWDEALWMASDSADKDLEVHYLTVSGLLASSTLVETLPALNLADFPGTCPECMHPAYLGLNQIHCSNRNYKHTFNGIFTS